MSVGSGPPRSVLARLRSRVALSSLRVNFAWTAFGNAFYMASQWALLMVLAKASSPEVVGGFSYALALSAPIVATSMMGLRQVIVTDTRGEHTYGDYLALRVATSGAAGVVIAVVAMVKCDTAAMRATALLVGAAKLLESVSDIVHGRFQWAERMDRAAVSLFIKGCASLTLMGSLLFVTKSLVWASAGMVLANAGVLFFFDLPQSRKVAAGDDLRLRWNLKVMARLTRIAAPITACVLFTSTAGSTPRYYLEAFRGPREVGYYTIASAPLLVMGFLPAVLNQATLARAARYYQAGEHDAFVRLNGRVMAVNMALNLGFVAGAALLGHLFLRYMYTAEYEHLRGVMVIFTLSQTVAVLATIGVQLISAARMFVLHTVNAVIALAALYLASRWLVPTLGVRGSAWAEVIRNTSATLLPLALTAVYLWRRDWITDRTRPA